MKTYVIAEMAWSHTGYFKKAIEMLEGASSSGADAISIHITDMGTYMTEDYRCIAGVTLSDSADDEAPENFTEFISKYQEHSWSLIELFLNSIDTKLLKILKK